MPKSQTSDAFIFVDSFCIRIYSENTLKCIGRHFFAACSLLTPHNWQWHESGTCIPHLYTKPADTHFTLFCTSYLTTLERSTKLITFRAICIELVCMLNSFLDVVIWSEATSKTSESINLLQSILKKKPRGCRRQSVNVCGWELKTLI